MNIRYKYEYVKDGVIKIVFVMSADNDSIILSKNLSADQHSKKTVGEKLEDAPSFKNI